MLSRVADSLYWMSRYLERAENTVRLLDVTMSLMLDAGGAGAEARWQRMVAALGKPAGMEWNGNLEQMAQKARLRSARSGFSDLLPERGTGKCAASARRDLDRAMAAAEPAVSSDPFARTHRPSSART